MAIEIQTKYLIKILTKPIQNSLIPQITRQCLVDTLRINYYISSKSYIINASFN